MPKYSLKDERDGFALVIALGLMAFVLLLILSISTLVSVETANAQNTIEKLRAEQNALLALSIAVGELQSKHGSDQSASGTAGLLDKDPSTAVIDRIPDSHRFWTGVWVRDPATGDLLDPSWLVSGEVTDVTTALAKDDYVTLIEGFADNLTVDDLSGSGEVKAPIVAIDGSGEYAYAALDEGVKARINLAVSPKSTTALERLEDRRERYWIDQDGIRNGTTPWLDLDPSDQANLLKISEPSQITFIDPSGDATLPQKLTHEYTLDSASVLADPRTGKMQIDLSKYLDPSKNLSSEPDLFLASQHPFGTSTGFEPTSWERIQDFASLHTQLTGTGITRQIAVRPASSNEYSIQPTLVGTFVEIGTRIDSIDTSTGNASMQLCVGTVIWLMNPYDVSLAAADYRIEIDPESAQFGSNPPGFKIQDKNEAYVYSGDFEQAFGTKKIVLNLKGIDFYPGEVRIFSAVGTGSDPLADDTTSGNNFNLIAAGLNPFGVFKSPFTGMISLPYDETIDPVSGQKTYTADLKPRFFNAFMEIKVFINPDSTGLGAPDYHTSKIAFYDITSKNNIKTNAFDPASGTTNLRWTPVLFQNFSLDTVGKEIVSGGVYDFSGSRFLADSNPFASQVSSPPAPSDGITMNTRWSMYRDSGVYNNMFGWLQSDGDYGYWGPSSGAQGLTHASLFSIPRQPIGGVADLMKAQLINHAYEPTYPLGHTVASPYMGVILTNNKAEGAYWLNDTLWNGYFASGLDPSNTTNLPSENFIVLDEAFDFENATADETAARMLRQGGFNVHSTSISGWRALLGVLREQQVDYLEIGTSFSLGRAPGTLADTILSAAGAISMDLPLADGLILSEGDTDPNEIRLWRGFRALSDEEIDALARAIVRLNKERFAEYGSYRSTGDFINRNLKAASTATASEFHHQGILETAIEEANISGRTNLNTTQEGPGDDPLMKKRIDLSKNAKPSLYPGQEAIDKKFKYAGLPGHLDTKDVLSLIGDRLTHRSDTFTIRTYGAAINEITGKTSATAYCEAVVQRFPDPINNDGDYVTNSTDDFFGRRYRILSVRWIPPAN
jgi:hypothetical protein